MNNFSEINCPNCFGKIIIDPNLLLQGMSFICSNPSCDANVSLSKSSSQITENALNEFEKLKKNNEGLL